MDIHPANKLKVLGQLKAMGQTQDDCVAWMQHWMHDGLSAYQVMLPEPTRHSFGDRVTQADLCLVGQMVNACRLGLDLSQFDRLVALDDAARALPEIAAALPEAQPDATP